MAKVVITLKIMPDSPEADLSMIEDQAKDKIITFSESPEVKVEHEPIAFGLKAVNIMFIMDEDKGDTEVLEKDLGTIEHVQSVSVTDVRRTLG